MGNTNQWKIRDHRLCTVVESSMESKTKTKKTSLTQCGMLRIWWCDCALCVIGNSFPCRKPHNPTVTLLRGHTHTTPRTKTARRFTAKNPTKMWEIITSTVGT